MKESAPSREITAASCEDVPHRTTKKNWDELSKLINLDWNDKNTGLIRLLQSEELFIPGVGGGGGGGSCFTDPSFVDEVLLMILFLKKKKIR